MENMDQALAELTQEPEQQVEGVDGQEAETAEELFEILNGEESLKLPPSAKLKINHNGQVRDVELSKAINGWRQVSHIEQKQKEFKQQQAEFQQKMAELDDFEGLKNKYGAIQDWSEKNPEQFSKLWELYENKEKHLYGDDGAGEVVQSLTNQVRALEEKLGKYDQMSQEQEDKAVVEEVNTMVSDFKNEFPYISLDETDEDGISLEKQIINFGAENGYPTFRSAAMDYKMQDGTPLINKLLDTAKRESRNAAVKSVKQDKLNGVVGRSSKPFSGQGTVDTRRLKESERHDMALDELKQLLNG